MTSKYFTVKELVSKDLYNVYGDKAIMFIDEKLIYTIDAIREFFDAPVTINNWQWGGNLHQRCLRGNCDEIVKNKTANKNKFPYLRRIENIKYTPTWVHIDCANTNTDDLIIFNA